LRVRERRVRELRVSRMVRPRVVVLDYGSGNLRSAQRALERAGADAEVTADLDAALNADGRWLPECPGR
jgi:imidazoleglycerol phosphate synthase glutamine amidotransferase subunit HisH